MPICLFWIFRPGEGKMKDLSRSFCFFKNQKGFHEYFSLPFPVSNLSNRPSVRIFNGSSSRNANSSMKFPCWIENHGRKTSIFQNPCSQSNGLAAERSGRGEKSGLDSLSPHLFRNGLYCFFEKVCILPLKSVKGISCWSQTPDHPFFL